MIIIHEPAYRAFWHDDCDIGRLDSPMRPIGREKTENRAIILECLKCRRKGRYWVDENRRCCSERVLDPDPLEEILTKHENLWRLERACHFARQQRFLNDPKRWTIPAPRLTYHQRMMRMLRRMRLADKAFYTGEELAEGVRNANQR